MSDYELRDMFQAMTGEPTFMQRDVLWDWALSRVERVWLPGASVIVKRSRFPLIDEGRILEQLKGSNVAVPDVLYSNVKQNVVTLVLEDFGPVVRSSTLEEAALAATRVHRAMPPDHLPLLDRRSLAQLATRALQSIRLLQSRHRWLDAEPIAYLLGSLESVSDSMSDGAEDPPFGLCHSEFHPSSLVIGRWKTGLVDWAKAFVGPGLIDLASYNGTVSAPDPHACRQLIDAYVTAGGAPEAARARAGLRAECWALFWHRLWTLEWFVRSCATWMDEREKDADFERAVLRHATEALDLVSQNA